MFNVIKDKEYLRQAEYTIRNGELQSCSGYSLQYYLGYNNESQGVSSKYFDDDDLNNSPYRCEICKKIFKYKSYLIKHLKRHYDIRPYSCEICNKAYVEKYDLKMHKRIHNNIRPFQCSECDKSFTQRCQLESHMTYGHNAKMPFKYRERRTKLYVCEECGITTNTASENEKHTQEFHFQNKEK